MKNQQSRTRDVAKKQLYAAIFTALFVAMAVSVKSITKVPIPILGAGGMQISFGGIDCHSQKPSPDLIPLI